MLIYSENISVISVEARFPYLQAIREDENSHNIQIEWNFSNK